jgi:predicted nucleotidyltransferase
MTDNSTARGNPILAKFRADLNAMYGERIERVVLYGSRARGDAKPDSEYDIAVFIKDPGTFTDESERLAAISTDILVETGAVVSATPFPAGAYRDRTGFMHELRKDGLDL